MGWFAVFYVVGALWIGLWTILDNEVLPSYCRRGNPFLRALAWPLWLAFVAGALLLNFAFRLRWRMSRSLTH